MSNHKKWIIAAAILLGTGVLICGISFAVLGFDFRTLDTVEYVTNAYDVSDDFQNISIKADVENITFVPSDDGTCKVVCREEESDPHQVSVRGDTLTVEKKEKYRWQIFNNWVVTESPEITVYLPNNVYKTLSIDADTSDVNIPKDFTFDSISVTLDTGAASCLASVNGDIFIETDTGHITISDVSAAGMRLASDTGRMDISNVEISGDMDIRESTGRVTMENVTCRNLTSNGDTGSLIMTNVTASGEFNLERDTGNIEFNGCDAETIYVKTDTGNVTGSLLSDKVFITQTDTGKMDVPKTITGGRCEITTDTGNISIEVR